MCVFESTISSTGRCTVDELGASMRQKQWIQAFNTPTEWIRMCTKSLAHRKGVYNDDEHESVASGAFESTRRLELRLHLDKAALSSSNLC